MPIYAYRCQDCSTVYEEQRKFEQAAEPSICPVCEGLSVQRLISAPVFIRGGLNSHLAHSAKTSPSSSSGGCACSTGGSCACRA